MPWLSLPFQVFYNNLYVIPIPEFSYALTYSKCLHQTWKENKNQRAVRGLFQITITFHIIQQLFGLFCKHNYKPPLLLPSPPGPPPPLNFYRPQTWYKSSQDTPYGSPWGLPPVKKGFAKYRGWPTPIKMTKTFHGETIGRTKICIKYDF